MKDRTEELAAVHLGKKSGLCEKYNPALLVAVPRCENRKQYNIQNHDLPFEGWDVWHAYEFSSMTENGLPVTKIMKLKYNCNNDYLIESKSLKLYLNSFNMSRFGKNIQECLEICKKTIETDLSSKLETNVCIDFLDNNSKSVEIFKDFHDVLTKVNESELRIEQFKEAPEVIEVEYCEEKEYKLQFGSLRSNCRVTHQPDFGEVFIYYKSDKHIKEDSLVKYLCSFRSEYHFHEECCEMIYKRIYDVLGANSEIFVCALYTRRGGIDICPARWSKCCEIHDVMRLLDTKIYARNSICGTH